MPCYTDRVRKFVYDVPYMGYRLFNFIFSVDEFSWKRFEN